jgi:L-alanine-DL-glutamate epimerase-like enolase superfamily enzyme
VKGKRVGLPVWRLLGGDDPATTCVMVAGYPTGDNAKVLGERVAEYAREGHSLVKVAYDKRPEHMRTLLEVAVGGMPGSTRLIVDTGWAWTRAQEALADIALWSDAAPLAWIEDPLPPEDIDGYARLMRGRTVPIGVGDDYTDVAGSRSLVLRAGVDVLRIDVPAIGGVGRSVHLAHVAEAAGAVVSFHVYPETSVQVAAGLGRGALTETFDGRDNAFDPAGLLYEGGPAFSPDKCVASEAPGFGLELDHDFIAAHAID